MTRKRTEDTSAIEHAAKAYGPMGQPLEPLAAWSEPHQVTGRRIMSRPVKANNGPANVVKSGSRLVPFGMVRVEHGSTPDNHPSRVNQDSKTAGHPPFAVIAGNWATTKATVTGKGGENWHRDDSCTAGKGDCADHPWSLFKLPRNRSENVSPWSGKTNRATGGVRETTTPRARVIPAAPMPAVTSPGDRKSHGARMVWPAVTSRSPRR